MVIRQCCRNSRLRLSPLTRFKSQNLVPSSCEAVWISDCQLQRLLHTFIRRLPVETSSGHPVKSVANPADLSLPQNHPPPETLLNTVLKPSDQSSQWDKHSWLDRGWDPVKDTFQDTLLSELMGKHARPVRAHRLQSFLDSHYNLPRRTPLPPPDPTEGPSLFQSFEQGLMRGPKSGKTLILDYKRLKRKEPGFQLSSRALMLVTRDLGLLGMCEELLEIWDTEKLDANEVVPLWKASFDGVAQVRKDQSLRKLIAVCRDADRGRLAALLNGGVDEGVDVSNFSGWDLQHIREAGTLSELMVFIHGVQKSGRQVPSSTSEAIFSQLLRLNALDEAIELAKDHRLHVPATRNISRILARITYGHYEAGYALVKQILIDGRYFTLTDAGFRASFRLALSAEHLLSLWEQLPSNALRTRDISPYTLQAFLSRALELTRGMTRRPPVSAKSIIKEAIVPNTGFKLLHQCIQIVGSAHGWTQKLLAPVFAIALRRLMWMWTSDAEVERLRRQPHFLVPLPDVSKVLNGFTPQLREAIVCKVMWLTADVGRFVMKNHPVTWDAKCIRGVVGNAWEDSKEEIWPFPILWPWLTTLKKTPLWDDVESEAMQAVERVVYMKGLSVPYLKHRTDQQIALFLIRNRLQTYLEWDRKLEQDRSSVDALVQQIWARILSTDKWITSPYASAVVACREIDAGDGRIHLNFFKDLCAVLARLGKGVELSTFLKQTHSSAARIVLDEQSFQDVVAIFTKHVPQNMLTAVLKDYSQGYEHYVNAIKTAIKPQQKKTEKGANTKARPAPSKEKNRPPDPMKHKKKEEAGTLLELDGKEKNRPPKRNKKTKKKKQEDADLAHGEERIL